MGVLLVLLLALPGTLSISYAQQTEATGATVAGIAVSPGPDGESFSVPGATVTLTPLAQEDGQGEPPSAETDAVGVYRFHNAPDGCYVIVGSAEGLSGQSEIFCVPWEGDPQQIRVVMNVDALVESIEVSAEMIGIDPTETSSSGSLSNVNLINAPKRNRSFDDVMPLIPGVLRGPSGEINMNGARAGQGGAQLNGIDVTDPVVRTAEINLPIDAVSNVQVLSSPYDAQFGGFAGAVSRIETKPSDFDDYKVTVQNFTPRMRKRDGAIVGIESSTPRATITGPIKKGKLAFLQSTEYQFVRFQQEDANLPPLDRDTEREALSVFTQFDAHHSDKNATTANILFFPEKLNFFGLNAFTPQPSTTDLRRRGRLLSVRNTQQFDSGAVLVSNFSLQRLENDVRANSLLPSVIGLDRASGGFFNKQQRRATRQRWNAQYNFPAFERLGSHQLKAGLDLGLEDYAGNQIFDSVSWLGIDDLPVLAMSFGGPSDVGASKTDAAVFFQDKWSITSALTLDLGLRAERDSIVGEFNPSYRAGFAYSVGRQGRTVIRGGTGLFYDRISLFLPTFTTLPERTITRFGALGESPLTQRYQHRLAERIRNPKSLGWSLQVDREVFADMFIRVGYQQRKTTRNLLLEPDGLVSTSENPLVSDGFLTLSNSGTDSYREYQATVRYRVAGNNHLTGSYVRSSAVGDLNDVGSLFGEAPSALIRANQRAPLAFDAPNRVIVWADIDLPWDFRMAPVLELRQGFPYSLVNQFRDFVGPRNRGGRFPMYQTLDLQLTKTFKFPVGDKRPVIRTGVRVFNILNQFNPVDIQNNIDSPFFGTFYRGVDRKLRAVFEIGN